MTVRSIYQTAGVFAVACTAALIVYPWLKDPGYIFLLDFIWGPHIPVPDLTLASLVRGYASKLATYVAAQIVPLHILQPYYLVSLLLASGIGMYLFMQRLVPSSPVRIRIVAASISGILYMTNPFIVTRMLMGQHLLIAGYALTPHLLLLVQAFLRKTSPYRALSAGSMYVLVLAISIHHTFLLLPLLIPYILSRANTLRPRAQRATAIIPLTLLFTAAGLLLAAGRTLALPSPQTLYAHTLKAPLTGMIPIDILSLTATWNTLHGITAGLWITPVLQGALLLLPALAIIGLVITYTYKEHSSRPYVIGGVIAYLLALGISSPLLQPTLVQLFEYIPPLIALRDAGKWLAVIAFVQCVGIGLYIVEVQNRIQNTKVKYVSLSLPVILVLILIAFQHSGYLHRIQTSTYPESWYALDAYLAKQPSDPIMLFLPWHLYAAYSYTHDHVVANPAPTFFEHAQVISGDNLEIGTPGTPSYVYSDSNRPLSTTIQEALNNPNIFRETLIATDIQYVALDISVHDAHLYEFLHTASGLTPIFHQEFLYAWKVEEL